MKSTVDDALALTGTETYEASSYVGVHVGYEIASEVHYDYLFCCQYVDPDPEVTAKDTWTMETLLRHGKYFSGGTIHPMTWGK